MRTMDLFKRKVPVVHICPSPEKPNLEKLYSDNKDVFQELMVKEFVGYIPKEINEPTLKFFSDNAGMIQKWVLWQSWYVNRKSIHDPLRLARYEGMMVYLAVLHKLANASAGIPIPDAVPPKTPEPEMPMVEKELSALNDFRNGFKKSEDTETKAV